MQAVTPPDLRNRSLDATDREILRVLGRNARASWTELGAAVGLSANAATQRVRRLEAAGWITGYRAMVRPDPDARGVSAVVLVQTAIDVDSDAMEAAFAALPEVVEVLDLAGAVDYELRVRCVDQAALHAVVQRIRLTPGVTAMQTRPVLREVLRRDDGGAGVGAVG